MVAAYTIHIHEEVGTIIVPNESIRGFEHELILIVAQRRASNLCCVDCLRAGDKRIAIGGS